MSSTRQHVEFSPSSSERAIACPGSLRLIKMAPPERPSRYAEEGTAAHALLHRCYTECKDAVVFVGQEVEGFIVDQVMAEAVQVCLDAYRSDIVPGDITFVETRIDLAAFGAPLPATGTADFIRFRPATGHLKVIDFKYGQGIAVEVDDNAQLRYYAAGACARLECEEHIVHDIEISIVQPRAFHPDGPIRSELISVFGLSDWLDKLFSAMRSSQETDAPLQPGRHCKFCRAASICPGIQSKALAVAGADFAGTSITVPPDPASFSPERLSWVLSSADVLRNWLAAVETRAFAEISQGRDIPGWKLVPRRPTRKWGDDDVAGDALLAAGLSSDEIYIKKIITPPAAEKLLGKEKKAAVSHLIMAESSGLALVPTSDKRQAVLGNAAADFDIIN